MVCELQKCCQFFKDNMDGLPQAAKYIKKKLCFGEYHKCTRYQMYKEPENAVLSASYSPRDEEEVAKITHCMRTKRGAGRER